MVFRVLRRGIAGISSMLGLVKESPMSLQDQMKYDAENCRSLIDLRYFRQRYLNSPAGAGRDAFNYNMERLARYYVLNRIIQNAACVAQYGVIRLAAFDAEEARAYVTRYEKRALRLARRADIAEEIIKSKFEEIKGLILEE